MAQIFQFLKCLTHNLQNFAVNFTMILALQAFVLMFILRRIASSYS